MTQLDSISNLKTVSDVEAELLCIQLRNRLLEVLPQTGGHLASNLGAVELTVAFHRVFDTAVDRLVFDVGHQCYCHKMLTGRANLMDSLRQFQGLSGYPKPQESRHDAFIAGHASNSVSVALGMAHARTLAGASYHVAALIGDGALTGGLAYEGLSNAGQSREPLLVILNDNGMSISKNVGGVADHLARQRLKPQYLQFKKYYRDTVKKLPWGNQIHQASHKVKQVVKESLLPCSMFEDMGFTYLGPVDGHNVSQLTKLLRYAKEVQGPVLVHIRTVKGSGYVHAEANPDDFHGVSPFSLETGHPLKPSSPNFSTTFGKKLAALAKQNSRICAITAAMGPGTGLNDFSKAFPDRFFDVGIAEGHAVSMAAGLAKEGRLPVFAVYSSFLQRSYDMLIHDISILNLPVLFAVDRAGLVGEDGETHHGLFDVAYLSTVPHMTVLSPASLTELEDMLEYTVTHISGPTAIRYPRGGEVGYHQGWSGQAVQLVKGGTEPPVTKKGQGITLVTYGTLTGTVLAVAERLEQEGYAPDVVKLNQIHPLDMTVIQTSVASTGRLLVAEECLSMGCVGEKLGAKLLEQGISCRGVAYCNVGTEFIPQGTVTELSVLCGLDVEHLYQRALEVLAK